MPATMTAHTWMTHAARRTSASSGSPLAPPKASPCVLEQLGHARPQAHAATEAGI
jgi:hypothetical protein